MDMHHDGINKTRVVGPATNYIVSIDNARSPPTLVFTRRLCNFGVLPSNPFLKQHRLWMLLRP